MRRPSSASTIALAAVALVLIVVGVNRPHHEVPDHHLQHFFFIVAGGLIGIAASRVLPRDDAGGPGRRDLWLVPALLAPVAIMFVMWPTTYEYVEERPLLHFSEHAVLVALAFATTYSAHRFARPIGWLLGGAVAAMALLAAYGYGVSPGPSPLVAEVGAAQAQAASGGAVDGRAVYEQNCAACHQAEGGGVPGAFPPLAGHLGELLGSEGGRDYVVRVLLYGLQGPIAVQGQSYAGVMPAWAHLGDEQIAAVLSYVAGSWGNEAAGAPAFTSDEVAAARDEGLTPRQVLDLRGRLELP